MLDRLFLTLDQTKEKDIEKVQVLLRNIMNNCSTEQNMFVFYIRVAQMNPIIPILNENA
jgi:hypothetical protein